MTDHHTKQVQVKSAAALCHDKALK